MWGQAEALLAFFETAYVSGTTVTGTVLWQKAIPCSLAQGHGQGWKETCHLARPAGHFPPDPWGRVTPPREERSLRGCSSWVRCQEPFLIAFFQSWQSQPDPNVTNGLPDWPPPQMDPSPSAALWFSGLQGQRGPLHPSSLPTGQELPSTISLLQAHTPMTGSSPPALTAASFREKPTASCNTEGRRDMPVTVGSTQLALPGHTEGQEPVP